MDSKYRIDRLTLRNYRQFGDFTLNLHPQFTLLVGNNGKGKTTVLEALALSISGWLEQVPEVRRWNRLRRLEDHEIRVEARQHGDRPQFVEFRPCVIEGKGRFRSEDIRWVLQLAENEDDPPALHTKLPVIWYELRDQDQRGENVTFPVLAYYGADRAATSSEPKRDGAKASNYGRPTRWDAYDHALEQRIRMADLQRWFEEEALAALNRGGRFPPGYEAVKRAILRCQPGARDLWYDPRRREVVLDIGGNPQPFSNLSQGQAMMLALVADIAIKAVTLNAFLLPPDELGPEDDPLPRVLSKSPGIILIDELDVHLHPRWQRRVPGDLKAVFPSMQFVCTSHSPQIIGELEPDEIRLLDDPEQMEPAQAFGMDTNWILEVLMQGSDLNPEISAMGDRLHQAIAEQRLHEARALLEAMREKLHGDNADTRKAAALLQRMELTGK